MTRFNRNIRPLLACALFASSIGLGGCQWMAPKSSAGGIDVDRVDRATLQDEYRTLSARSTELESERERAQRELAIRTIELENQRDANRLIRAELDATLLDLHYLESQFITLESQLTQEESKASAVAAMADTRLVYDRLRQGKYSALSEQEWLQVDDRMAAADNAVARDNFTAAVYYSHRAMRLLDRSERESKSFLASGSPRVVTVELANFRKGPGAAFAVIGQLTQGVVIVELERKNDWSRIKTRSGAEGWIHEALIR